MALWNNGGPEIKTNAGFNPFDAMADHFEMVQRLKTALTVIASFDDADAESWLKRTGSYSRFDEPASVRIAREALRDK